MAEPRLNEELHKVLSEIEEVKNRPQDLESLNNSVVWIMNSGIIEGENLKTLSDKVGISPEFIDMEGNTIAFKLHFLFDKDRGEFNRIVQAIVDAANPSRRLYRNSLENGPIGHLENYLESQKQEYK